MAERQPFKAFLEHDLKTIHALGKKGRVRARVRHPRRHDRRGVRPASRATGSRRRGIPDSGGCSRSCTYQPQVELLGYLRENGFKTFIVSGGGIEFIRAFAEEAYGIPPEQVIGSSLKLRFELQDGAVPS